MLKPNFTSLFVKRVIGKGCENEIFSIPLKDAKKHILYFPVSEYDMREKLN